MAGYRAQMAGAPGGHLAGPPVGLVAWGVDAA